jgi:hypothetical protein
MVFVQQGYFIFVLWKENDEYLNESITVSGLYASNASYTFSDYPIADLDSDLIVYKSKDPKKPHVVEL